MFFSKDEQIFGTTYLLIHRELVSDPYINAYRFPIGPSKLKISKQIG